MKYLTLNQFVEKYREIKSHGFIKIIRKGDGKFGNTFEDLLGIEENNFKEPDTALFELKVQNNTKNALQTLFNKEGKWIVKPKDFLERYGWEHSNHKGELTCQSTVTVNKNKRGFYFDTDDEKLYVKVDNNTICEWDWKQLTKSFINKFPSAIKVYGQEKIVDAETYFHYNEAYLLKNTSESKFKQLIEDNIISIDFRLYTQYNMGKSYRNRGTSFRINQSKLDKLFIMEELN